MPQTFPLPPGPDGGPRIRAGPVSMSTYDGHPIPTSPAKHDLDPADTIEVVGRPTVGHSTAPDRTTHIEAGVLYTTNTVTPKRVGARSDRPLQVSASRGRLGRAQGGGARSVAKPRPVKRGRVPLNVLDLPTLTRRLNYPAPTAASQQGHSTFVTLRSPAGFGTCRLTDISTQVGGRSTRRIEFDQHDDVASETDLAPPRSPPGCFRCHALPAVSFSILFGLGPEVCTNFSGL